MRKERVDLEAIAEYFLKNYEDTVKYNTETAHRLGYVKSLLENTCRLIEEDVSKKYNKKFVDNIEEKYREQYEVNYIKARNEARLDLIKELVNALEIE